MKKTLVSVSFAAALLLSAATAQAESRMDLARQYMQLPGNQQMMKDLLSPQAMLNQLEASLPRNVKISNRKKRRIGNVLSQGMMQLRPSMDRIMLRESARIFTKAELRAMIKFYASKEGASILAKMPQFMENSMTKLGPQIQKVQEAVAPAIYKIIKD